MLSMFNNKEEIAMVAEELDCEKDQMQHMKEYIESLKAIEEEMVLMSLAIFQCQQ